MLLRQVDRYIGLIGMAAALVGLSVSTTQWCIDCFRFLERANGEATQERLGAWPPRERPQLRLSVTYTNGAVETNRPPSFATRA